jgi:hypothetical protein
MSGRIYVLVLAALEGVADEVRDSPEEADDLAVVHSFTLQFGMSKRPYSSSLQYKSKQQ